MGKLTFVRRGSPAGKEAAMQKNSPGKSGAEDTAMQQAMDMTYWQSAKTDPQGSYTGTPADPYEVPVQDADDL